MIVWRRNIMVEKERQYLESHITDLESEIEEIQIFYSDKKVITGVISENFMGKFFECKTVIDTVVNLDKKIKYSLEKAIEFTYSDEVVNEFNMIGKKGKKEFLAYYFIENAFYRTITSWDSLAQLYNSYFSVGKDKTKINYKTFFYNLNQDNQFSEPELVANIYSYLSELNDISGSGRWLGNHNYIKEYRNKVTHRNSPDIFSLSNFDINFKESPRFVLKRLIEDYHQAECFLKQIINYINEGFISQMN
jgi:hypothetical protein